MAGPEPRGSMRRRDFIRVVVGSAAALPFAARAQQPDRMRRIGVLTGSAEDDQETKLSLVAFQQRLQQLGWTDGQNVRIDYRFAAGKPENFPKYAAELVALLRTSFWSLALLCRQWFRPPVRCRSCLRSL